MTQRRKLDILTFLRGLETTQLADGAELPVWPVCGDVRFDTGSLSRRPGMVRCTSVSYPHTALDFDGAADYVTIPYNRYIQRAYRIWTLRALIEPDTVTGTQTIVSWDHAAGWPFKLQLNGSAVLLTCKFSDNSTDTATGGTAAIDTICAIQAMRRPAASGTEGAEDIELWVDGAKVDSITDVTLADKAQSGGMLIGADTGPADLFNGTIDHVSLLNSYLTDQTYGWMRLVNPKASSVVCDYWMEEANANTNRCDDRSANRNHGTIVSAPGSVTGLAVQTTPVSMLAQRLDYDNQSRLDVVAGSQVFLVSEPLR